MAGADNVTVWVLCKPATGHRPGARKSYSRKRFPAAQESVTMPGNGLPNMIGTKLNHYTLTAHLGSGGMGDVYQATDTKLGRSVAIKILPEAFARETV